MQAFKIIKLKKLPRWAYTSPMSTMSERKALIWAEGRGVDVLYYCIPMEKWLIRMETNDAPEKP